MAALFVGKTLGFRQTLPTNSYAKPLPFGLRANADRYPLIVTDASINAVRRLHHIAISDPGPLLVVQREVDDRLRHKRQHALQHREIDIRALARALPVEQRQQQSVGDVDAADRVRQNRAEQSGRAVRIASDLREAAEGVHRAVVADVIAPRPGAAERARGEIDQGRIDLTERLVAEAQLVHGAGREILGDDVTLAD